jgi:hypothetical protein
MSGEPRTTTVSHGPPAYRVWWVGRHSPKPARPPIHFPTAEAFRPVSRLSAAIPHAALRRTTAPRASASLSRTDVDGGLREVVRMAWHARGQGFKSPQLHQAQRIFSLRSERHLPEICQKPRSVFATHSER